MREKGFVFNFREEMCKYCAKDVTILRFCCVQFRELFISETIKLIRLCIIYSAPPWSWPFIEQTIFQKIRLA